MRLRATFALLLWLLLPIAPAQALFRELEELGQQLQQVKMLSPIETIVQELARGRFTDVDARAWYAPYVATMARLSIVSGDMDVRGIPTGTFRPNDFITVAEALKIVFRAAGVDERLCTSAPVNVHASQHWSRAFVACAEGLQARIPGPQTTLDRFISRAELLALMDDVFGDEVPAAGSALPFRDIAVHRYAQDIAYNARQRIVSGDLDVRGSPTGFFRPDDPVRRSETAKIVSRKMETKGM